MIICIFSYHHIKESLLLPKKYHFPGIILLYLFLQGMYISAFPDSDVDAYVHFIAARILSQHPLDLAAHWVWLPFYHYVLVIFVLLGLSFQTVRLFSVASWFASALLLRNMVNEKTNEQDSLVTLLAVSFFLFMPTAIVSASSVEPEAFFTFLMLASVYNGQKERFWLAGLTLGLACLIRYEAWIMAIAFILFIWIKQKFSIRAFFRSGAVWLKIFPALFLAAWFFAKWHFYRDGSAFLTGTKSFAESYTDVKPEYFFSWLQWLFDATFYMLYIPLLASGPFLYFAYRGVKKTVRHFPLLATVSLACLFFISCAWWFRYTLGLFRHFTVILPFFSICLSYGLSEQHKKKLARLAVLNEEQRARAARTYSRGRIGFALLVVVLLGIGSVLWKGHLDAFFADRREMAAAVAALPDSVSILCCDNTVEIFSNKNARQFSRLWADTSAYSVRMLSQFIAAHPGGYIVLQGNLYAHLRPLLREKTELQHDTYALWKEDALVLLKIRAAQTGRPE